MSEYVVDQTLFRLQTKEKISDMLLQKWWNLFIRVSALLSLKADNSYWSFSECIWP